MNSIKYIFSFLTTIPIPRSRDLDFSKPGYSMYLFFLVGVVLSVIISLFKLIFGMVFSESILAILTVVIMILLTGGLHLDGLADCFDGLAGNTPEKRFKIMKDSFIGSFGVTSIVIVLLLKTFLIKEIILLNGALIFPVVSRSILPLVIYRQPVINENGISFIFKSALDIKHVILNLLVSIIVVILVEGWVFLISILLTILFALFFTSYFSLKLKGVNGDVYGATIELSETVYLLISIFILGIL